MGADGKTGAVADCTSRCDVGWRLSVVSQILAALDDLFGWADNHRLELIAQQTRVMDLVHRQVVAKEVQHRILIPRSGNRLQHGERFIPVLNELKLARAVESEVGRHRGRSDLVVVDLNEGTRRITDDGHPSPHAPAG